MKLISVTNGKLSVLDLASQIIKMKDTVDFVHIREKSKSIAELVYLLQLLKEGDVSAGKLVIHDRLDLSLVQNIPNIHLPASGFSVKSVRKRFPSLRIGRSVHSLQEAENAETDGADYVLYGHIFETNSKKGIPPRGLEELSEIKRRLHIPVYAIGGITPDRVSEVQDVKTDGVAVMSGIFSSRDPAAKAKEFFDKCREGK